MTVRFLALWLAAFNLSCAPQPARLPHGALVLRGSDGKPHDVWSDISQQRLTVFVFYSEACPCMRAHEERLKAIAAEYAPRGVALLLVDSELSAQASMDARVARARAYPFPLLTDADARLGKSLNAQFATHAVVVDAQGNIRYSGGIDSDKNHLRATATPYLRDALDALLSGRDPPQLDHEPLGCALQLR